MGEPRATEHLLAVIDVAVAPQYGLDLSADQVAGNPQHRLNAGNRARRERTAMDAMTVAPRPKILRAGQPSHSRLARSSRDVQYN